MFQCSEEAGTDCVALSQQRDMLNRAKPHIFYAVLEAHPHLLAKLLVAICCPARARVIRHSDVTQFICSGRFLTIHDITEDYQHEKLSPRI